MIYVQLHHFNGEIAIYEIHLNKNVKNKVRREMSNQSDLSIK